MKSRKLRELLGNTTRLVHFADGKVCVGSSMVSQLISVDAKTLEIKYALDAFHVGRASLSDDELKGIWDKLVDLVNSGELRDIIEGNDPTDGMFPVYSCDDGVIVERFADVFGWPHSCHDGTLMYDNTFFKTREEAIASGVKNIGCAVSMLTERIGEAEERVRELRGKLDKYSERLRLLKEMAASNAQEHGLEKGEGGKTMPDPLRERIAKILLANENSLDGFEFYTASVFAEGKTWDAQKPLLLIADEIIAEVKKG